MKIPGKKRTAHCIAVALAGSAALSTSSIVSANTGLGSSTLDTGEVTAFDNGREPITFRVPAGDTQVTLSGYVKADFISDSGSDLGDSFGASGIPVDGAEGDGNFRIHARQTRFRIKSESDLASGKKIKTLLEGDFFGGGANEIVSNSSSFRLRHAYLEVGGWGFGQFWTNFMDFIAYPTTVDFFGPAGKAFIRAGQIRYTFKNGFSISAENPETTGGGPGLGDGDAIPESLGGIGLDRIPDFTIAWKGGPGGAGGTYKFAAVARTLGVDGTLGVAGDVDDDVGGFGFNAAGAWDFGFGALSGSVTGGSGLGRYVLAGVNNDIFVDENGNVEAVDQISASISYVHRWSDSATSLVSYGFFDNDDDFAANGNGTVQTLHVNYIWKPNPRLNYGAEVIFGNNEPAAGGEGDAVRLHFGAQLNF